MDLNEAHSAALPQAVPPVNMFTLSLQLCNAIPRTTACTEQGQNDIAGTKTFSSAVNCTSTMGLSCASLSPSCSLQRVARLAQSCRGPAADVVEGLVEWAAQVVGCAPLVGVDDCLASARLPQIYSISQSTSQQYLGEEALVNPMHGRKGTRQVTSTQVPGEVRTDDMGRVSGIRLAGPPRHKTYL
jgi:hypothetical protein